MANEKNFEEWFKEAYADLETTNYDEYKTESPFSENLDEYDNLHFEKELAYRGYLKGLSQSSAQTAPQIFAELENNYKAEIAELEEALYDITIMALLFGEGEVDNQGIVAYEKATGLLARRGRLINVNNRIYKIKR